MLLVRVADARVLAACVLCRTFVLYFLYVVLRCSMDVRHGGHLHARNRAFTSAPPSLLHCRERPGRRAQPEQPCCRAASCRALPEGTAVEGTASKQTSTRALGHKSTRARTHAPTLKLHCTHQVAQNSTTVTLPPPSFTGDPCTKRPLGHHHRRLTLALLP